MNRPFYAESDRVRAALSVIPADDYKTWVDMAFAVKNGLGEAGFDLWDAWSRSAANYDERAARATWKSAREDGGKTLASLFWLARQHGLDPAAWRGDPAGRDVEPVNPARDGRDQAGRDRRRRRAQTDLAARHQATAEQARMLWREAWAADADHPYLSRKGLVALDTLRELDAADLRRLAGYAPQSQGERLTGRVLLAPVHIDDVISTLEFIDEAGRKSTLAGGAKAGGYWAVGVLPPVPGEPGPILIAEGVATALSAHLATGWFALATLSAGNLPKVAQTWRRRYPDAELVILSDRGKGEEFARRAASDIDGRLAIPVFAANARIDGKLPTDFNDMAVLSGRDAVKAALVDLLERPATPGSGKGLGVVEGGAVGLAYGEDINIDGSAEFLAIPGEILAGMPLDEAGLADSAGAAAEDVADSQEDEIMSRMKAAMDEATPQGGTRDVASVGNPHGQAGTGAVPSVPSSSTRRPIGEPLYALSTVSDDIKALAKHRFGVDIRMGTPRENGGPYRGEVFDVDRYLIQEVAPRSVVFHARDKADFVSERLKWAAEHQRLNGTDVQIGYEGDIPKVYPWDRARDNLDRAVASLKKSAKELGLGEDITHTLERLQAQSWSRVKDARRTVLARVKDRARANSDDRADATDRANDGPQR